MTKKLIDQLLTLFPEGLSYKEAIEISKALFYSTDWLPDVLENEFSLDKICEAFAFLSNRGFIYFDDLDNNQHNFQISSKNHWMNIIHENFNSSGNFYDEKLVSELLTKK